MEGTNLLLRKGIWKKPHEWSRTNVVAEGGEGVGHTVVRRKGP